MVVLAGCKISVTPLASNFRYQSSWTVNGQPVACDNRDTFIGYSFNVYDLNQVSEWTELYTGVESGVVEGPFAHTIGQAGVILNGNNISVENRFRANEGFLPLSTESDFETSAIIVVPITPDPESQIGTTRLSIAVTFKNGITITNSQNIPIYGNCAAG